ncbi:hypothetical protein [Vitreoscilla stercoraria]|uniref:Uncharacterized protein n=1 Tax=Vitreoscilla stercoraria TaxID=61 RepID=A0ABY4EDG9_VITST|nr:hypothetical protein [Vitreoscilla stercoraria]UOO93419.1 hypothetical protein LVJ81_05155 [Vitreoscilla stercoraria]
MEDSNKKTKVRKKDSQLLIRINGEERDEFVQLCEQLDTSAARELRKFIRDFMKKHKVSDQSKQE